MIPQISQISQIENQICEICEICGSNNSTNWLAVVDFKALATGHFEAPRIEAHQVQHGGVDVGDVVAVLDGVEADLVGDAVGNAALDAAAGQPGAEALRMMVAAVALGTRRAAELRAPDDDRLFEQA